MICQFLNNGLNREIVHKLFPQIRAAEGMEDELNRIALSDRNPIQKLMRLFALLEKENVQFKNEYMEFYSVIRFLKPIFYS